TATTNHTYSTPGTYTLLATVYGSSGKFSRASTTVTVASDTPPFGWVDSAVNSKDGSTTIPQYTTVSVKGWAADKEDGAPVTRVQVFLDGSTLLGNAALGGSRPDVATS